MWILDRKKMPKIGIRTKILIAFLGRFIVSFGLLGYIAFNNIKGVGDYTLQCSTSLGGSAVNESAEALENRAEEYLLRLANDQADISNTVFEKVEAEVNVMAKFASALWSNSTSPGYGHSYSQEEEPDDYICDFCLCAGTRCRCGCSERRIESIY
jgi:hypothetical protein